MARVLCLLACVVFSLSVHGFEEREFKTPEAEATYTSLIKELRCLVCQNQNIADSDAELAVDLRREIFSMIEAGQSEDQILDFMVQRYGEFVLYKPRLSLQTLLLWFAPALLLLFGAFLIWRLSTKSSRQEQTTVDQEALARAQRLLEEDN